MSLDRGEARVVLFEADGTVISECAKSCRAVMSAGEQERKDRYVFERNRIEYALTRLLVRTTLSRCCDVEPQEWTFRANEYGRPEIDSPKFDPPIRFNVSNTEGLIACVVTLDREVGIDVENRNRPGQTVEIADQFFSPTEVAELRRLSPEKQRERFFECWTLKESYIKARGMGLSLPLDQFTFHLNPADPVRISFDPRLEDDPESWQFVQLRPTEAHVAAVAIRKVNGREAKVTVSNFEF